MRNEAADDTHTNTDQGVEARLSSSSCESFYLYTRHTHTHTHTHTHVNPLHRPHQHKHKPQAHTHKPHGLRVGVGGWREKRRTSGVTGVEVCGDVCHRCKAGSYNFDVDLHNSTQQRQSKHQY